MTIVQQRKSKERIRRKELKILFREINNLEKKFKEISYKYIPREENTVCGLSCKKGNRLSY